MPEPRSCYLRKRLAHVPKDIKACLPPLQVHLHTKPGSGTHSVQWSIFKASCIKVSYSYSLALMTPKFTKVVLRSVSARKIGFIYGCGRTMHPGRASLSDRNFDEKSWAMVGHRSSARKHWIHHAFPVGIECAIDLIVPQHTMRVDSSDAACPYVLTSDVVQTLHHI